VLAISETIEQRGTKSSIVFIMEEGDTLNKCFEGNRSDLEGMAKWVSLIHKTTMIYAYYWIHCKTLMRLTTSIKNLDNTSFTMLFTTKVATELIRVQSRSIIVNLDELPSL